jgi:hypothetical protein
MIDILHKKVEKLALYILNIYNKSESQSGFIPSFLPIFSEKIIHFGIPKLCGKILCQEVYFDAENQNTKTGFSIL